MRPIDEAARLNELLWDRHAAAGDHFSSRPKATLDAQALRDYAAGRLARLPKPWCDAFPERMMMESSTGKDVLCLASGGGHQSAEFGLLGARVTVLDLSRGQLRMDEQMAALYGYAVRTVQGDMRDLSAFGPTSFDRVVQGVGLCFVPNVLEVYREVARVLRPGGLYSAVHENPFTYPAAFDGPDNGWDGKAYRIVEPYLGGAIRRTPDGRDTMGDGEFTGEFRHLFCDILNGLIESGLAIIRVGGDVAGDRFSEPGSSAHMQAVVPQYFCTIASKS